MLPQGADNMNMFPAYLLAQAYRGQQYWLIIYKPAQPDGRTYPLLKYSVMPSIDRIYGNILLFKVFYGYCYRSLPPLPFR